MAELEKLSFLRINGVEAPTPLAWSTIDSTFDSDDSVRDETGYLNRTVIRRNQHAPKFSWRLRGKDLSRLLQRLAPERRHGGDLFFGFG